MKYNLEDTVNIPLYYMIRAECDAKMIHVGDEFIILKGSKIDHRPARHKHSGLKTRALYADKIEKYILTESIPFTSASGAATFVANASMNGKDEWKTSNLISLAKRESVYTDD